MVKKMLLGVVVVVCLCSAVALALDPMGAPVNGLKKGQWSAGFDYSYTEMDLEHDGDYSYDIDDGSFTGTEEFSYELENNEMHKAYLNIGYGICDKWGVFMRLGGASLRATRSPMDTDAGESWLYETHFDSDTGFAAGLGTKVTLWEDTKCKIGGLFQASWATVDYSVNYEGYAYAGPGFNWGIQSEGEMDFWEMQFAIGALYELSPKFSIYGGPFYHIFIGDYDFSGPGWFDDDNMTLSGSYDVKSTGFGGYLGAQIDITENVVWNAEYQLVDNGFALGTGLAWRF